ncbi:hypothetical protein ACWCQK_41035, partial [Streptomyces sp. NPDC002306]
SATELPASSPAWAATSPRPRGTKHTYNDQYNLTDTAKIVNEHATTCRALPRYISARPDDARRRFRHAPHAHPALDDPLPRA